MTIPNVKSALEYKIAASGRKLPADADLSEVFYDAMLWVATKCAPTELIRKNSDDKCFRNLENGFFVAVPDKPIFDETDAGYRAELHLQIDEALNYAVINRAAYMLTDEPRYQVMANEIISEYIAQDGREGDSVYI